MEIILGVIVSLISQVAKKYTKGDRVATYAVIVGLSLGGAAVYVLLQDTEYWPTIVAILTSAGAFHNFIIRRFEEKLRSTE